MSIIYRYSVSEDAPDIYHITETAFPDLRVSITYFINRLNNPGRFQTDFLLAEDCGEIVGYAELSYSHTCYNRGTSHECVRLNGHLCNLAVLPKYRRQGVGSELLQRAEQWTREKNCFVLELEAEENKPDNIAFYEKRGYAQTMRIPRGGFGETIHYSFQYQKEVSTLKKGLFWVVGSGKERHLVTYAAECDANGAAVEDALPYNSKKGGSFSHERSWAEATKEQPNSIRSKPWDYFPRGRVEIKNGKATVYYNPALDEWVVFELAVTQIFGLRLLPKTMSPDYSQHYKAKQEQNQ